MPLKFDMRFAPVKKVTLTSFDREGAEGADQPQCAGASAQDTECGKAGEEPDQSDGEAAINPAVTNVQKLIDALPTVEELESMSQDEQGITYEQVQAAYDAYTALTDEQKAQINGAEVIDDLFAVFNGVANALTVENSITYLDADGKEQSADNVTIVDSSTTWSNGWYVVNNSTYIHNHITVTAMST